MFGRFTEDAQQIVIDAQTIATHHGLFSVNPNVLLAALTEVGDNVAKRFLIEVGVTPELVKETLLPKSAVPSKERPGLEPRVKTILEQAFEQARILGHYHVGPEHILLGLLHTPCEAARFLSERGVTRERFLTSLAREPGEEAETKAARRDNVISVRLDDASLRRIDTLVKADIFSSRSAAASYLISKGILAQMQLLEQVEERLSAIESIQDELKELFASDGKDIVEDGDGYHV